MEEQFSQRLEKFNGMSNIFIIHLLIYYYMNNISIYYFR